MGFYIRKSFRAGPIRLNLSKSGLGLSAGVTGLRVGTGPRGAYVHGGRGGLYYRKYAGSGRSGERAATARGASGRAAEEVFIDTGVTYPCPIRKTQWALPEPAAFPRPAGTGYGTAAAGALLVAGLLVGSSWVAAAGAAVLLGVLFVAWRERGYTASRQAVETRLDALSRALEAGEDPATLVDAEPLAGLAQPFADAYRQGALLLLAETAMTEPARLSQQALNDCARRLKADDREFLAVKIRAFRNLFDRALADAYLDEEEEAWLVRSIDEMGIPAEAVQEEAETVRVMARMRDAMNERLQPLEVDVPLRRGEVCYFATRGRLVKRRVLQRRSVQGVQVREVGFEVDREGPLYVTNRRVLLVDSGTWDTRINQILDVTLSSETNLVELSVDGRKTPVYLTAPDAPALAVKIEQAVEAVP